MINDSNDDIWISGKKILKMLDFKIDYVKIFEVI